MRLNKHCFPTSSILPSSVGFIMSTCPQLTTTETSSWIHRKSFTSPHLIRHANVRHIPNITRNHVERSDAFRYPQQRPPCLLVAKPMEKYYRPANHLHPRLANKKPKPAPPSTSRKSPTKPSGSNTPTWPRSSNPTASPQQQKSLPAATRAPWSASPTAPT
jgi:hypothetical protein